MKRWQWFFLALGLGLVYSFEAGAADPVLVLSAGGPEYQAVAAGFKSSFAGKYRELNLEGNDEKVRKVGEELKAAKPSVTVVVGDLAAQMAKWYLEGLPVVYCDAPRAGKIGLSGSKVIGIYHEPDPSDQLRSMKDLFPGKTRVGVLYNPQMAKVNLDKLKRDAQGLGLSLQIIAVASVQELPNKLRDVLPKVDVLQILTDPVVLSAHSIQFLVMQSLSAGVSVFCGDSALGHGGATAALVPDLNDVGTKAAQEAGKVVKNASPSFGTVIYPKGKLVLNKKMAAALKISFPPAAAAQAQEVIQ